MRGHFPAVMLIARKHVRTLLHPSHGSIDACVYILDAPRTHLRFLSALINRLLFKPAEHTLLDALTAAGIEVRAAGAGAGTYRGLTATERNAVQLTHSPSSLVIMRTYCGTPNPNPKDS